MLHWIPYTPSPGLAQENAVHARLFAGCDDAWMRHTFPHTDAYLQDFRRRADGRQFIQATAILEPGSRVLDIGAGPGQTSLHLALQGHRVTVAEPSPDLCRYLDSAVRLYGVDLDIFNLPGEELHHLAPRTFDACIFHGSLHHCDDPVRALRHCHALLRPGGRLLLTSEPILRGHISKERFQRILATGTMPTGDYGGNEHSYYHHEYLDMLRQAGFVDLQDPLIHRYACSADYLDLLARENNAGRAGMLVRRFFYGTVRTLQKMGPVGRPVLGLLKKMSLVQVYFLARKAAEPARRAA